MRCHVFNITTIESILTSDDHRTEYHLQSLPGVLTKIKLHAYSAIIMTATVYKRLDVLIGVGKLLTIIFVSWYDCVMWDVHTLLIMNSH